jgi:hypothetical protein
MRSDDLGYYGGSLAFGILRAPLAAAGLVLAWLAIPFAVQMIFNPSDAVGLQFYLAGGRQAVPHVFTNEMLNSGVLVAIVALGLLSLVLLALNVLFYGLQNDEPLLPLWPVALVLCGIVGNGVWWAGTGIFDPSGAVIGLMPVAATITVQMLLGWFGKKFVFGEA